MLSRLSCRSFPQLRSGFANLRTQARQTVSRDGIRQPVAKDYHYYGRLILGGGALLGGVTLMSIGKTGGMFDIEVSALARSQLWPAYVTDRLHKTYLYFGAGIAVTGASMYMLRNVQVLNNLFARHPIVSVIGIIGAQLVIQKAQRSMPYTAENMAPKHVLALSLYGLIGLLLSPAMAMGGPALTRAALCTGGLVAGLTGAAVTAPSEKFLTMSGPLMMGFGAVFAASIATNFMGPTGAMGKGVYALAIYGGVVLFSALLLYQTQKVVAVCEKTPSHQNYDPIIMSTGIYMSTINLFTRILMIMGGNKRK